MQQWEYFVFHAFFEGQVYVVPLGDTPVHLEQFLEHCGEKGWELVSIVPSTMTPDNENQLMAKHILTTQVLGVLKRMK